MKKFLTTICAALVFCFVLSGTVAEAKTTEYKNSVTTDFRNIWSNGTTKIYLNKARTKLCEKNIKTGKVTVLKTLKATEDTYYTVENVYGNKIYMNHINYLSSDAYVYNKTTKKLKKVKKSLYITGASGKYMIAMGYVPSDTTPNAAWIYKVNGDSIKKVKTLGNSVSGMKIVNGKIYFASYTDNGDSKQTMKVCTCDLNGQNKKVLFTRNIDNELAYANVEEFNEDTIVFVEGDGISDTSKEYVYDIASGEIQEVNE